MRRIVPKLEDYAEASGRGEVFSDNAGFAISKSPSGRESLSPDAAYHVGAFPANKMRYLEGAAVFAVEVRCEGDYDPAAEAAMAEKRVD